VHETCKYTHHPSHDPCTQYLCLKIWTFHSLTVNYTLPYIHHSVSVWGPSNLLISNYFFSSSPLVSEEIIVNMKGVNTKKLKILLFLVFLCLPKMMFQYVFFSDQNSFYFLYKLVFFSLIVDLFDMDVFRDVSHETEFP